MQAAEFSRDRLRAVLPRLQQRLQCARRRRQPSVQAYPQSSHASVERLVLAEFLEQDHGQQVGSGKAPWGHMDGAGGWVIVSHSRHENFSRTVCITFHCRRITSSVSVMSSPSFANFVEP